MNLLIDMYNPLLEIRLDTVAQLKALGPWHVPVDGELHLVGPDSTSSLETSSFELFGQGLRRVNYLRFKPGHAAFKHKVCTARAAVSRLRW